MAWGVGPCCWSISPLWPGRTSTWPRGSTCSTSSLPAHRKNGYLDTKALPWLIGSGLICAALAAWLSAGLEVTLLRKLFGAFLIVIGLHEIFSKVRKDE